MMTTAEASEILGVARKTVAAWCVEGRLGGAVKTSESGEWRIPSGAVYGRNAQTPAAPTSTPRLWSPSDR